MQRIVVIENDTDLMFMSEQALIKLGFIVEMMFNGIHERTRNVPVMMTSAYPVRKQAINAGVMNTSRSRSI